MTRARVIATVDVGILLTLLLAYAPQLTGLALHEWIGLGLVAVVVVHLLLSWRWIATATRMAFTSGRLRTRVNYALNWLLFTLIVVEVASGVVISQAALPAMGVTTLDDRVWRAVHNLTLNWTLLVTGFHVAMNWSQLARFIVAPIARLRGRAA